MTGQNEAKSTIRKRLTNPKIILIVLLFLLVLGAGTGAALVKASEDPAFCQTCHIMDSYYTSWNDSNLSAHAHAAAGVTCHDCHESSISIQANEGLKFITGNYENPLEKRKLPKSLCLSCHSESATGPLKGTSFATAQVNTNFAESNPHDSHNGEQQCNLCHNMHQPSTVMCSECHSFDWFDELDDSWKL